jgi:hypothetical protein
MVDPDRPQTTICIIRPLHISYKKTNAINIQSEYVILNDFPLQQLLHEHTSLLRSVYIVCLVNKRKNCTFICLMLLPSFTLLCLVDLVLIRYVLW